MPTPVAVKLLPTVLLFAPINVKSVVPTDNISYFLPTSKAPAVFVSGYVIDESDMFNALLLLLTSCSLLSTSK